jgi:hypothetical protein
MLDATSNKPLLVSIMNLTRLSWYWTTVLITIVLFLLLILVGYLDGVFNQQLEWEFWRTGLLAPSIIVYILLISPVVARLSKRAIEAFRPLVTAEQSQFDHLIAEVSKVKRWQEWLAVLLGFIFMLALSRPWIWVEQWIDIYQTVTYMLMFGLLGWLIYSSIYGSRNMSKLCRQDLKLDIFDANLLSPLAHLSLGNSLAFVGGISLSMVFQTQENLIEWQAITIYSVLVLATIFIFFLTMWNVHKVLARIKRDELGIVHDQLVLASRKLKNKVSEGQQHRVGQLSQAVAGWAAYEGTVREAKEWPFSAAIIRRLFASILAPISIYLIKILSSLGIRIGS